MSKLVYLDSNDFSDLSAPQLNDERQVLLRDMRDAKENGNARYFLSAVHLSEAIHAAMKYKESAVLRAKLMGELCDSNLLRLPADIFRLELDKAISEPGEARLSIDEISSRSGEWFGVEIGTAGAAKARQKVLPELDKALAHLPRRERRRIKSQLSFSKRNSREAWKILYQNAGSVPVFDFPFSLLNRDAVFEWFLGERSDEQINEFIIKILSDPFILFQHVIDLTSQRETLYDILRQHGEEWVQSMQQRMDAMLPKLQALLNSGADYEISKKLDELFKTSDIEKSFVEAHASKSPADLDLQKARSIVVKCPSASLFIKVSKSYYRSLIDANIARLKAGKNFASAGKTSDFGDFMHLVYAPYFDVFRCDARFGALLKQHPSVRGQILDRRPQLGPALRILQNDLQKAG